MMTKTMTKTMTALVLVALLPAGAVLADDDDCHAPRDQWQSTDAAMKLAQDNGWTVREFEVDDGCYKIEGRDGTGRKFEAKLDPATLSIVDMEDDDDDDDYTAAANPAPAGTVAPPQNGLFGAGAAPQVQMK